MGTIIMGIMIPRSEAEELREPGWFLIFGRRKTGKSFMVRHMVDYDRYFFVTRGGAVIQSEGFELLPYKVFLERFRGLLRERITLVVDEFQRLPEEFLDVLHHLRTTSRAKVLLIGSSMSVARRMLERRSPLVGIVRPVRIGLIDPRDILKAPLNMKAEDLLRIAPYIRDPWILEFVSPESFSMERVVKVIRYSVRALVGEVFSEEDRVLTDRYEMILRALSLGNSTPGEVASYISGLVDERLKSQDVKSYLANLVGMGIVERVKVRGRRRYIYRIESPLVDLFYYLDSKLGFQEVEVPLEELVRLAEVKAGAYYEDFIVKLLAEVLGGRAEKSLDPEVDGIIVRGGEILAAVEVKLGQITRSEVRKFLERTPGCRRIVVAREGPEVGEMKLLTPEDLVRIARGGTCAF